MILSYLFNILWWWISLSFIWCTWGQDGRPRVFFLLNQTCLLLRVFFYVSSRVSFLLNRAKYFKNFSILMFYCFFHCVANTTHNFRHLKSAYFKCPLWFFGHFWITSRLQVSHNLFCDTKHLMHFVLGFYFVLSFTTWDIAIIF